MHKTPYYDLPIYEPSDSPSLIDGYNKALLAVDAEMHALQNDINLLKLEISTIKKELK